MSEDFCAGVKILLSRIKSNPEEFVNNGKWSTVINEVFAASQGSGDSLRGRSRIIRALTDAEIQALYVEFKALDRASFDAYVMEAVLEGNLKEVVYSNIVQSKVPMTLTEGQYIPPKQSAMLKDHIDTHRSLMAQGLIK